MAMKEDRPAGVKEIADALGCCAQTIRRYHKDGKLPTFQLGGAHSSIKMTRVDLRRILRKGVK
jgi:predicted site-specific integrase-resolvase